MPRYGLYPLLDLINLCYIFIRRNCEGIAALQSLLQVLRTYTTGAGN